MMMPRNEDRFYCEEYPDVVPRSYFQLVQRKHCSTQGGRQSKFKISEIYEYMSGLGQVRL